MLLPKKALQNVKEYEIPMFDEHTELKLDSNENNFGPSPKVLEALRSCDISEISFYPYYGELTEKVAKNFGVKFDQVKITNGADEALQSIIQTYLNEGESLLTLDIAFEMPNIYTLIQGGIIKEVPFEKKWVFPLNSFMTDLKDNNVKVVYLTSPNNPTANVIAEGDLVKILESAKDKVVILDETYANYCGVSYVKYINKYDNLFVVRSFSKDYALAGLRLGCIISNEENIINVKKVLAPYSINSLVVKAAMAALDDNSYICEVKEKIEKLKSELKLFFENFGFTVYPSSTNFLLINCGAKTGFIYNCLKNANISVKMYKKGPLAGNYLRITIPTETGVNKIKSALKIKPYLVFDMDGVLINAKASYREAIAKTFEYFAKEKVLQEEIQKAKNLGGLNNDWDLTKFLLEKRNISVDYSDLVKVFQSYYWNDGNGLINNETPLFDRTLFEELKQNYNLAIFTGRLRNEAMFALNKFGVADMFYPIITTDDIPFDKCKPDPFGINKVKELTIADKYYYFGDTTDDIKSACGAGCVAVGVLPPQDKSEELSNSYKKHNAKYVLQSINNIKSILE